MKKETYRPSALTAVTALFAVVALFLWAVCMYCLTSVTAEYAAARYLEGNRDRASNIADGTYTSSLKERPERENYLASKFWEAVSSGTASRGTPIIEGRNHFIGREDGDESFIATAIYDAEGKLVECSWKDFIFFEYLTEEEWTADEERSGDWARVFFDREKLTEAGKRMVKSDYGLALDARAMRFTGTFDGVEFVPVKIEFIDENEFWDALHEKGNGTYTVPGLVRDYDLQWRTFYENPGAVPQGTETVVFYSDWFGACYMEDSPSFTYFDKKYEDVAALVEDYGTTFALGYKNLTRYEGADLLIVSVDYCYSYEGITYTSPYYHGPTAYQGEPPELHFYMVSAVYCSPWRTAVRELWKVYLWTLALVVVLVLLARGVIKRRLIEPMDRVSRAMAEKKAPAVLYGGGEAEKWREARDLTRGYQRVTDLLRSKDNEVNRLNAALDYAKNAEENRRQMTSNVAHELKTPLAVVHSYAEGLKEQIAEDKRDKYLDVILSETERMDAMVLEMLDLSRLEAGRVKLARDEFSLAGLARAVFDRLEMAIQAKELKVEFHLPEQSMVTADEGRIAQVIENFATNAVKYTPPGGTIRVRITVGQTVTSFAVENDSPPLSKEALSKVWDTFYRAEESRSSAGTGLGLAIARNIILLHGGRCAARNTKNGVEFSFTIGN